MACNVEIFLHVVIHRVSHFAGVNNSDYIFKVFIWSREGCLSEIFKRLQVKPKP